MRIFYFIFLSTVAILGCCRGEIAPKPDNSAGQGSSGKIVKQERTMQPPDKHAEYNSLLQQLGKKVTLEGIAQDGKVAAMLLVGGASGVYIDHLTCWPNDVLGKRVRVTGTLIKKKVIPDPVERNGVISAGAYGEQLLLTNPKWEVD